MSLSLNENLQAQMRHAYYDGAPGVLTSGLVWILSAYICYRFGVHQGVWALLIGGACIYPISAVLTKILGRPAKTSAPNALNQLAGASTIWLIACCVMAYGLYQWKSALFFPAMMLAIGSRYTVFATLYGQKNYWVMGLSLMAGACVAYYLKFSPMYSALLGGLIELVFAGLLFSKSKTQMH